MKGTALKQITLANFLSYGEEGVSLDLGSMNVLVGPNGAGKSNLLDAIGFLSATTKGVAVPVRMGGGVSDWIYKGNPQSLASIGVVMANSPHNAERFGCDLEYAIKFACVKNRFEVVAESLTTDRPLNEKEHKKYVYYDHDSRGSVINVLIDDKDDSLPGIGTRKTRRLKREDIESDASILSQRRDPMSYPELTYVHDLFSRMRIYREWSFGISSAVRQLQPTDAETDSLMEDFSNIAMFVNRLQDDYSVRERFLKAVSELYEGITDVGARIESGRAILRVTEKAFKSSITANRLSDGSLRFICLAALLLDPNPPPMICLDEPELGMHPDMIRALATLLKEASSRTQVVMTTHSVQMLDAFTDMPEALIVCERENGKSSLMRLSSEEMKSWTVKYSLGRLWRDGVIGGNRW